MSMSELDETTPEPEPELEPEPDDGDEEGEAEGDTEPGPELELEASASGFTPEELEKRFGKLDTSFKTYTNAVSRNLEEYAQDLIPCPLCTPTPHPAFLNRHDMGRIPPEIESNVKLVLGLARETDYPQHPGTQTCITCMGLGKVQTGSLVPDHAKIMCPSCNGYGYTPPPGTAPSLVTANGAAAPPSLAAPSDFPQEDRDAWGEPRVLPDGTLNDNYGRMPQFKSPHPVYGVTAGLSPLETT